MYAIPHPRMHRAGVVGWPMMWETPLRTGNLRDPNGQQATFASESFIDELAAVAKIDPVTFRIDSHHSQHHGRRACSGARAPSPSSAAVETYGWDARPSPKARAVEPS